MLLRDSNLTLAAVLCVAAFSQPVLAQTAPPVILEVDFENTVMYFDDNSDYSKLGTVPGPTTATAALNFRKWLVVADIVAVNGRPVRGTRAEVGRTLNLRTAPNHGEAIADTTRNNMNEFAFEFVGSDGTPIGTIAGIGLGNGDPPPGAPLQITQGNNAIVGGTGAFLGVRGLMGQSVGPQTIAQRQASVIEDPSNRRINGVTRQRYILLLFPMSLPQIVAAGDGPAVFHSDFVPVTAARPARAGEVLIVRASGLGPTRPGVNPGQPFPQDTTHVVNSPVEISVNGSPAQVVNAFGWPGLTDTYRIDFRVPDGTVAGMATLQLTAAWIPGTPVKIAVQ
jgi:uncharacterized protein (TIGR03437 family)